MKTYKYGFIILFILGALLINGCASVITQTAHFQKIEESVQQGNYADAIVQLENGKGSFYQKKERVLYYLDLGTLHHYNGDYDKSNELLTEAENAIEELYTKSVSKAAASLLLNDNALDYSGEDYEDIYINIFKALNYLELEKFDEAFVEIRRINQKLNLLEDKYGKLTDAYSKSENAKTEVKRVRSQFHNSILARYLSMLIYAAEGKFDDAKIDLRSIEDAWIKQANIYNFAMPRLNSTIGQTGKYKLSLVAFTGKAPYKKAVDRRIATSKNTITIQGNEPEPFFEQIFWPGVEGNYYFKFSLPVMQRRDSSVRQIKVYVDGKEYGKLSKIEDVGNIAIETFAVKVPLIYFKSMTRSVVKGLIAEKAKEEMKKKNEGWTGILMGLATDIAVDISENADLRTSRFLPNEAYVGDIELAPGVYSIRLDYVGSSGGVLYSKSYDQFEVKEKKLNLISNYCPY